MFKLQKKDRFSQFKFRKRLEKMTLFLNTPENDIKFETFVSFPLFLRRLIFINFELKSRSECQKKKWSLKV